MNVSGKEELLYAIDKSTEKLQQNIAMHCCLVFSLLGKDVDQHTGQFFSQIGLKGAREQNLRDAITETIEVLEESRKAMATCSATRRN